MLELFTPSKRSHNFKDLTNLIFNRWTVIEYAGSNKNGVAYWKCRCECGQEFTIAGGSLKRGISRGCASCAHKDQIKAEIGKIYNNWTVIEYAGSDDKNRAHWLCRCECGRESIIRGSGLRNGHSKSCSVCVNNNMRKDELDKKYGRWTVLEYVGNRKWLCCCECGKESIVRGNDLRNGISKGCITCAYDDQIRKEVGKKYNRWTVLEYAGSSKKSACWLCRCECGEEFIVFGTNLRRNHSKGCRSCGSLIHGHAGKSSEYSSWHSMKQRCLNSKNLSYKYYGGRGISMDPRWENFILFLEDMGPKPAPGYHIHRIDNDGDYCQSNCVWISMEDHLVLHGK